ncbi:MAG TPA: LacI family DNA-binding transcriptional regulator [Opitutaceae bacterium]|nr:LacI family DNA-binding transcriptional regulator [Opitutaceae bacterium]
MSETNQWVTMADVAKQAGVHTTTVSLALRNHPSLPDSTRRRLQTLAEKMGYQPDPALRALIAWRRQARPRKDAPTLAYLTHWDTKWGWQKAPAHAQFFAGATAKARRLGYKLEHFWLGEPRLSPQRMSGILRTRGINGVIVASCLPGSDGLQAVDWSRFSAVRIDYFPQEPELHTVTNDQRAIIQLAMRRVVAAGYRRIGFVIPSWWDRFSDLAWSAGFLAEQHELPPEGRIPILRFDDGPQGGSVAPTEFRGRLPRKAFEKWLQRYQPEVLISREEFVEPQLTELGLAVPRDIALVEIFLEPDGRTAGVRQNCDRVGELAVEILAGQLQNYIHGIPTFPTTTLVEGTWFDGSSLPPRRAPAPAVARPGRRGARPAPDARRVGCAPDRRPVRPAAP